MKRKLQALAVLSLLPLLCPMQAALAQAGRDDLPGGQAWQLPARDGQGDVEAWEPDPIGAGIVAAARAQLGNTYDASYVAIPYPNGDVPAGRGLCADVVVRALRGVGCDLQYLIHEDRKLNFRLYPRTWGWGRRGPDPNSDHRCVPNQMFFFRRFGLTLAKEVSPETIDEWQPGDLVYWNTGSPLLHAGIVSDAVDDNGLPLVIHMSGDICAEDNSLLAWPIIGHFRFRPGPAPGPQNQDLDADR